MGRTRDILAAVFSRVVARESQLAAATAAYAWRVPGSPLLSVRRLFAEQGRQMQWWLSEIGSRAAALGVALKPAPGAGGAEAADNAITSILAQHEAVAEELRATLEELRARDPESDAVVLLDGLLEFHETSAWMLRLLLESPERSRMG